MSEFLQNFVPFYHFRDSYSLRDPVVSQQEASGELARLTVFDSNKNLSENKLALKGDNAHELFYDQLLPSAQFLELYEEAAKECVRLQNRKAFRNFKERALSGAIFQMAGSGYLAGALEKEYFLLSTMSVMELNNILYPYAPFVRHPLLPPSLGGRVFSDNYIVTVLNGVPKIVSVAEITAQTNLSKFVRGYFFAFKRLKQDYPDLFIPNAYYRHVVPSHFSMDETEKPNNAVITKLPINYEELRDFRNFVAEEFRITPESSTLRELYEDVLSTSQ